MGGRGPFHCATSYASLPLDQSNHVGEYQGGISDMNRPPETLDDHRQVDAPTTSSRKRRIAAVVLLLVAAIPMVMVEPQPGDFRVGTLAIFSDCVSFRCDNIMIFGVWIILLVALGFGLFLFGLPALFARLRRDRRLNQDP